MDPIPEISVLNWLETEYEKTAADAAAQQYADPKHSYRDSMIDALHRRIADLEARLSGYIGSQMFGALFSGPMREIIVMKKDPSSSKQGQQRILAGGVMSDFTGGLHVTSDTDPAALYTLASDEVCVLRQIDANGNICRSIIISGSTAEDTGEFQGMNKTMVSQNASGWDGQRAWPVFP